MKMNRRNALLGLGAIATGGGALFGSGAFSNVEAQRSVGISVTGDQNADIEFNSGTGATGVVNFKTAAGGGNKVIEFNEDNLNDDAITRWKAAMEIKNTSGSKVNVEISGQTDGSTGSSGALQFQYGSTNYLTDKSKELDNNKAVTIDIVVDLRGSTDPTQIPSDVTFKASNTS
jgi:hypothetical protein